MDKAALNERLEYLNSRLKNQVKLPIEEIIRVYNEALEICEKLCTAEHEKEVITNFIKACTRVGQFSGILQEGSRLIRLCVKTGDEKGKAWCFNNMSMAQWRLGNYSKAMEFLCEAMDIYEVLGDKKRVTILTGNLGLLYGELKDYDKSLEVIDKALGFAREQNLENSIANFLNNKGVHLNNIDKIDIALECFFEAMEINQRLCNESALSNNYQNLGDIFTKKCEYHTALNYYSKAEKLNKKDNNEVARIETFRSLGTLYSKMGDYDRAINNLEKALSSATEMKIDPTISDIYKEISAICESKGDYKKALEAYWKHSELQQKIFNDTSARKIAELKVRFETEKKMEEAKILKSKNEELARINSIMKDQNEELKRVLNTLENANKLLRKQAVTDGLTGLYNQQIMYETLDSEIEKAKAYNTPLSLIMLDLDNFKQVNDVFGHTVGDHFLKSMSKLISHTIRRGDIPFRYGGEEFLVILPHAALDNAFAVANRLRKKLKKLGEDLQINATVSGGVMQWKGQTSSEFISDTDALLYKAKENGRDRIER